MRQNITGESRHGPVSTRSESHIEKFLDCLRMQIGNWIPKWVHASRVCPHIGNCLPISKIDKKTTHKWKIGRPIGRPLFDPPTSRTILGNWINRPGQWAPGLDEFSVNVPIDWFGILDANPLKWKKFQCNDQFLAGQLVSLMEVRQNDFQELARLLARQLVGLFFFVFFEQKLVGFIIM